MSPTAVEIARAVQTGELTALESVEQALARIEHHRGLNAVISVSAERALARARDGVDGVLAGVPLLVKDVIDTACIRTTVGSQIYADRVPGSSAAAVTALEAAGAIVIAKTNCDEFAWGVTGQNPFYGDAQNPLLPGHVTGGSSSGNAAALAAGIAPLALGTDTGGSVRMPAGCCRVVGMKPWWGAVATAGVFPLCPSFDTVGPMALTVEDCVVCYEVLTGAPVTDRRLEGLRVGFLAGMPPLGPDGPDPEHDERSGTFAEGLESLGLRAEEVSLPVPAADLWPVFYAEAADSHRATFPERRADYGPVVRAKLETALRTDAGALRAGRRALAAWRSSAATEPAVDLVVCPTLGLREIPPSDVDELEIRVAFSGYTRAFSYLGWPAIALGAIQFAARDVDLLLAAARAWERAYGIPGPPS